MENQEHFGRLTDRMAAFREEVLDEKPYIDAERAVLATQAYKENQNQPRVMVRALMSQKILENMSIYIEDKSLIAGNQATKNKNAPIFPEYTMEFVMNELDLFEKDEMIIPSFINWGVKEEDAYNYSAIGCVETAVPGKWGYRCTGMSYINFPRVLLCAMNNGVDLTSKKRFTKGYGYFTEMETYEDLLAAWDKTVRNGVLLNQKMTPQMLSTEENKQKLEMLIRTFFNRLHGYHVQYNIVSKETLIDAQKHPEKHKDLIVRVTGYSAFFNVLSKKTQDDIIGRTEQCL